MQTLESLRSKMESAKELQSIVKTMKAMAAVNIRQCQRAVDSLAEYNRTIEMGLQVVLKGMGRRISSTQPLLPSHLGAVIFGSNQGMVGQFNQRIATHAINEMDRLQAGRQDRGVLAVGVLVGVDLEQMGQPLQGRLPAPWSVAGITSAVQEILVRIDEWRTQRRIEQVFLFYNRPGPGGSYGPYTLPLLPVDLKWLRSLRERDWPSKVLPTFSMDRDELFSALIRQYLFIALYRALAGSLTSENAHRLTSMEVAERNIEERLKELNTQYRQVRQSSITEELLDIIAGFEALSDEEA